MKRTKDDTERALRYDRLEHLERAQDLINQAIDEINIALEGTQVHREARHYILAHLDNWANGNNPHDNHIPNLMIKVDNG